MQARETVTSDRTEGEFVSGFCVWILVLVSFIMILCTLPLSLLFCIKIIREQERAVIFRAGSLKPGGAVGPGIIFILPCIDNCIKIDLKTASFDVLPHEVFTKDCVTLAVDGVVYYHIHDPVSSVANVSDAIGSTKLFAQTLIRNVPETRYSSEILVESDKIGNLIQKALDKITNKWGVTVERVELNAVQLSPQLHPTSAEEDEASRIARAKVIAAMNETDAFMHEINSAMHEINATNGSNQKALDKITNKRGVAVERVELNAVQPFQQLHPASAEEDEASRIARAKVIAAMNEMDAFVHEMNSAIHEINATNGSNQASESFAEPHAVECSNSGFEM